MKRLLLLLALVLSATRPAQAVTLEDMARFERAYIPALALTNQPQAPAARVEAALGRFESEWRALRPALDAGDAARIDALAQRMKAEFSQIYVMFGDFSTP